MNILETGFEVFCSCGAEICGSDIVISYKTNLSIITIEPCDNCLAESRKEGFDEGYTEGYDDGYDKGFDEGSDVGE